MEGRPCGDGVGVFGEIDSAAGYRSFVELYSKLRLTTGSDRYAPNIQLDRLRLRTSLGRITADVGRDVLQFGPSSRVQLGWGRNASPVDRVHLFTNRPLEIRPGLRVAGDYALARLRAPQTYPGNLASIVHGELDAGDNIQLGIIQLLQLEGAGAPHLGLVEFLAEHIRRRDSSASNTDSSNRRFGGDISIRVRSLQNARFYYQLIFEDIRKARFIDAFRYDADHLFGVELRSGARSLTFEWEQTGVRSQEHTPRVTGFTNAGYAVGSPLGPDASSFFVGGSFDASPVVVMPWLEHVALSSDTYEFIDHGPINPIAAGHTERRYRVGSGVRWPIRPRWTALGDAFLEHVTGFAFVPDATRDNVGITVSIVWNPDGPLGRLTLR